MRLNVIENGHNGTPIVLLHGLFGAARNLTAVQRTLSTTHRTLAIDLRNHGDSPHAAHMDYPSMAADVAETLHSVGVDACSLVGHSMGGKVAMQMALTYPGLVQRLAILDIAPIAYPPAFRTYAQAMQALKLQAGMTRAQVLVALADAVPDAGVRVFLAQNIDFTAVPPRWRIGLDAITSALPVIESWPDTSGTYPGPALFLAGKNSTYITDTARPVIRQLFPAARFARVRNAGHWVHADAPDVVATILNAFIHSP